MHSLPQTQSRVVFSIVSHGQLNLIYNLLADLKRLGNTQFSIILTLNIPEDESGISEYSSLPITIIRNRSPKGFGENHNSAFFSSPSDFFMVVNPDIRLPVFLPDELLAPFKDENIGACAPVVLSPSGQIEDSARRFPSFIGLFKRSILRQRQPDYQWDKSVIDVDWTAGMFVVFRGNSFMKIGGFDPSYFMYMEDADVCRRLKISGWRTVLQPSVSVIHDARRASRTSLRHLRWHLASAFRFLCLPVRKL